MKILVTAFEPFGGEKVNSTQALLPFLPERAGQKEIATIVLPVVFNECARKLENFLQKESFDYIICLGQNSGISGLNVERVAINVMDARISDNAGNKPEDELIISGGREAYFSTLPIKEMVSASSMAGVPAQVSNSAGTFVCNNLMYHVLNMTCDTRTKAGFIHVPQTPGQTEDINKPSMPSEQAAKGIIAMIDVL